MNPVDVASLAPELVLTVAGALILLLDAFAPALRRSFTLLAVASVAAAGWLAVGLPRAISFNGMLESSGTTLAFTLVVLVSTLLGFLASDGFLRRERILTGEYHALLLWCAVGLILMLRSTELLTLFLSLELFSLCLYTLAAFNRRVAQGTEGALKYFMMGAFVSVFILLGIALLYLQTGSTYIQDLVTLVRVGRASGTLMIFGLVLMIAGFAFKMSLVPFHAWSPDTYQGAPSPFVGFLSVAPKAASALVVLRLLDIVGGGQLGDRWPGLIAILAVSSMFVGNLLALAQRDIKRMLAYSGIAHMGYLAIALAGADESSRVPVIVYLLGYALMNAGAFAVVSLLYVKTDEQHLISDLSGFGYRSPLLAACLAVSMLSLGGIPPTLGFFGKYLVFLHAVEKGHTWLAVVGVLASLVAVYYYLRVVYTLYMKPAPEGSAGTPAPVLDLWGKLAAVSAAAATLVLGIWPWRVLEWVIQAVKG